MPTTTRGRRPRPVAHRAGDIVILNLVLWTWLFLGFGKGAVIQIVIWIVGGLAMLGWAVWTGTREEREDRRASGHCVSCGYDLQESASACPECGSVVPAGHRSRSSIVSDLDRVR